MKGRTGNSPAPARHGKTTHRAVHVNPFVGIYSPLLSNILLDELDKELESRGHHFIRYADDVSIFKRSKRAAHRVRASITRFLNQKLLLTVNEEKTSICRPVKFKLLGHGFVAVYKKGVKGQYRLSIAQKSWSRLKMKIKIITRKTSPIPFKERIIRLNQLMRGWLHYFKHATGFQKLKTLDGWIRCRLRYCIWKQWKKPKRRLRAFLQLGVSPFGRVVMLTLEREVGIWHVVLLWELRLQRRVYNKEATSRSCRII